MNVSEAADGLRVVTQVRPRRCHAPRPRSTVCQRSRVPGGDSPSRSDTPRVLRLSRQCVYADPVTETRKPTQCKRCGALNVRWQKTQDGRWVLMDTTGSRYQAQYSRGPHAATCPGGNYAEEMAKADAALAAYKAEHPE